MRANPALALLAAALFAGCIQVETGDGDDNEGDNRSSSQECVNGVCRTCEDGVCTGPLQDLRDEAAKRHEDVDVQETHDLMDGSGASWTFWVDPDASSHVVLRVVDSVAGQVGSDVTVCIRWEKQAPTGGSSGTTGNCSSGGNVAISGLPVSDGTLVSWDALSPGRYSLSFTAAPQPMQLVVDIVVDNP